MLRHGEMSFPDLWHLPRNRTFAGVAKHVTGPLLRAFPVRAKAQQLALLRELLWSALRNLNSAFFRELIEEKLDARSMTKTQRTYWLAAGFALAPSAFQPRLARSVAGSEARLHALAEFFEPISGFGSGALLPALTQHLDPAAVGGLIRMLGTGFPPIHETGWMTIRGKTPDILRTLIEALAASPEVGATEVLARLRDDPVLPKWHPLLKSASDRQSVVRRDAAYRPPRAAQVIEALNDGPPANAADLQELVVDRLQQITGDVRTTNVNLWRQFWNENSRTPKHEDACRDSLVATLRARLPTGCDAQPEGQYAANKRADIRVAASDWNVPVEIKKNSHSEVWSAVRNQLLPRYTNDPATEGLGIYLVLWFGPDQTASVPRGRKPMTPDAMRERLLANLATEERRRAVVIVMDVTPP